MRRALPFRAKILLLVLVGAVAPLAVVGLWLTRTAARSGQALLERRLEGVLDRVVPEVSGRWVRARGELLTLAEDAAPLQRLRVGTGAGASGSTGSDIAGAVVRASLADSLGSVRWSFRRAGPAGEVIVPVELPVYDRVTGRPAGSLQAELRQQALLGGVPAIGVAAGALVAVVHGASGASLLPVPLEPGLLEHERFGWGGEEWLARRRVLAEPPFTLVAAAPLSPFVEPFEAAARTGTAVLALVALATVVLAVLLTGRLTGTLLRLAGAADAVSRGDLDQRVAADAADEVGRVAAAFNAMTESLKRTLAELAQRESLAAVGEFASALAHEIRNPLTAIRVDLQRVEEGLPAGAASRSVQERALREVDRLERAVSGALAVARSGRITRAPLDLRVPLLAAAQAAAPEFAAHGAELEPLPPEPPTIPVLGDAAALEQVFLNLFLNAAQALDPGGAARLLLRLDGDRVVVTVRDNGSGIAARQLDRVFDPFFSTKPAGTGLGLAIARRIVLAHRGEIGVESTAGGGTAVHVSLPAGWSGAGALA